VEELVCCAYAEAASLLLTSENQIWIEEQTIKALNILSNMRFSERDGGVSTEYNR
jgi:hypothetical protein